MKEENKTKVELIKELKLLREDRKKGVFKNFTEHKTAEEALKESEEKYRNLIESANESIISIDLQGNLLTLNSRAVSHLGGLTEDYKGKTLWDIFPKKVADERFKDHQKVIRSGKPVIRENYVPFMGRTLCFLTSIQPIKNRSGDIYAVLILANDITDRKKIENALAESEEKYRTVFENTGTATIVVEEDMTISLVNSRFERLSGYSKEEIENKMKWTDIIVPEDLERMKKYHIARRKTGEKPPSEYEFHFVDKKGNIKNIFLKVGIIPGTKKDIASLMDITEQKQTEEAIQESENRFRELFNHMSSGVAIYEAKENVKDFIIKDFNRAGERINKVKKEDIIGKSLLKVFPGVKDFGLFKVFQEVYKTGKPQHHPISLYKDQRIAGWRENYIYKLPSAEIVAVYDDITERKQAEENMKNIKDELQMILDSVPALIIYKDTEGRIVRTNKTNADIFGIPVKDMIGKTTEELFPKEQAKKMRKDDQEVIISGKAKKNIIESFSTPDGIRWQTIDKIPHKNKEGKVTGVIGFAKDITVQRKSEQKLKQTYQRLKKIMDATINTMSKIIEAKDPYTSGHQHRVCQLAVPLAQELGLTEDRVEGIRIASLIHDIGKIGLPTEILSKPTTLADIELSLIKGHSQIGYDILKSIDFSYPIAQIVLQHHERLNGSGYPNNLKGDEILLEAKIIGVADVVEAMSSHRPYRPALGVDKALEEISQNRGILYDPEIVDACIRLFKEKGFKFE